MARVHSGGTMLPAFIAIARVYAPYIMLPVAVVIGTIGYNIEWSIRDRNNPTGGHQRPSVEVLRDERLLKQLEETTDLTEVESLKKHSFVSKTIFETNLSPSLAK